MRIPPALERWLDHHRNFVLLFVVLPLSFVARLWRRVTRWWNRAHKSGHRARVARVAADVLRARERGDAGKLENVALRTNRPSHSSFNARVSVKDSRAQVRVDDLNAVLLVQLRIGRSFVRVEPFITTGELMDYLLTEGYQLENTIEMRDATIGGLIMSLGMTSHSHEAGLLHDTALAYEIVTADGGLVRATPDNEHADLFRVIPGSHGTLGFLVAVELRVLPAPSYVRVRYHPVSSFDECNELMEELVCGAEQPYFLESFIYSPNQAVVVQGSLATFRECQSDKLEINSIGLWWKPFFHDYARSLLASLPSGSYKDELIPLTDYLMRHDRSMCMTMIHVLPFTASRWFRALLGWLLPPYMPFLKSLQTPKEREANARKFVYQDFCVPSSKFTIMAEWLDKTFCIYPVLVYPCCIIDRGGIIRLRSNRGRPFSGRLERSFYVDFGIFGQPKAIREGNERFKTVTKVRELYKMVTDWGGFQHTFCDVFATKAEFEEMFDHSLWRQMRSKYGAVGVFPTIYDKVKPELNVGRILAEESRW